MSPSQRRRRKRLKEEAKARKLAAAERAALKAQKEAFIGPRPETFKEAHRLIWLGAADIADKEMRMCYIQAMLKECECVLCNRSEAMHPLGPR